MEQIHIPVKGVSADIDPTKRDSLSWDFPTEGIRILNRDGQGLIVTLLPGNSNAEGNATPEHSITSGFTIIGACSYNKIIYLVSLNRNTGESELGSFPAINPVTLTLEDRYFPFHNLLPLNQTLLTNPNGRLDFRTSKLLFNDLSQVDVFAVPSYDKSVDLFMCDFQNPNLVINSGFTQNGVYNDRTYNDNSFPYGVRMIQHTDSYPKVNLVNLSENGVNLPGNYFLFFRYVTESFDKSAFLTEIGPISVHAGNTAITIEGVVDETAEATNKAINLHLSNLDQNYKYIEIGVWRYHGTQQSVAIREEYSIYKYYDITGTDINITISGNEERVAMTLAEVLNTNAVPPICKSHTTAGNRYIGANWKDITVDNSGLRSFAEKIYAQPLFKAIEDMMVSGYENNDNGFPQYKFIGNTIDNRTFMRGEIYPVAVVFQFISGKISDSFPTASIDMTISNSPIYDGKGLVRMPDYIAGTGAVTVNDLNNILGMWMNTSGAYAYYMANKSLFENVSGYYFVIGERKENTLYQGVTMACYNKVYGNNFHFGEFVEGAFEPTEAESLYIPYHNKMGFPDVASITIGIRVDADRKRYALFSPDYIMSENKKLTDLNQYYIKRLVFDYGDNYLGTTLSEYNSATKSSLNFSPLLCGLATIKNTNGNRFKEGSNWSTIFLDKDINGSGFAYSYYDSGISDDRRNKSIASLRYIGIDCNDQSVDLDNSLIAIQKYANPTLYWNSVQNDFSSSIENYSIVSEIIKLDDLYVYPGSKNISFKGDIFMGRTILRPIHWKSIPTDFLSNTDYPHGLALSMICESVVNTQMRNSTTGEARDGSTLDYTYFPKCLNDHGIYPNLLAWAVSVVSDDVKVEAVYVNAGYNMIRSGRTFKGFNQQLPAVLNESPNRVHVSTKHIPGSFINFYRIFGINSYKDFPWENGPINSIKELFGRIVTITDSSINEHLFNESQYRVPTSQGELLLGTTEVLAPVARKIASYGSRHTHGIGITESGIIGSDSDRDILWRVTVGEGGLKAENLSMQFQIQSECKKAFTILKLFGPIQDIPAFGSGITIGYDPDFHEIFITISNTARVIYADLMLNIPYYQQLCRSGFWVFDSIQKVWYGINDLETVLNANGFNWNEAIFDFVVSRSFHFSEDINAFLGTSPFETNRYLHNGKDFFSCFGDGIYRHNNESVPMVFYGSLRPMKFSVMVNGYTEGSNASQLKKIFKAGSIVSGPQPFESIDIETQFQKGRLFPFANNVEFWKSAVWSNHSWEFPLPLQDSNEEDQFQVDTDMRGYWARITFTYNSSIKTFIQSIRTLFNIKSS